MMSFPEKIENWLAHSNFWENLQMDYLVRNMLSFQRKLRTEQRNGIFEKI